MSNQQGLTAGYQKKSFSLVGKQARWCLLASPDSEKGSLVIHQDARVFAPLLDGAKALDYPLAAGRKAYLQVACGRLQANGFRLSAVGALKYGYEVSVNLADGSNSEALPFDLI